jgi:hypothetical protein
VGSVRLAALALVLAAPGCGGAHHAAFCGLARTVNGFDPVRAADCHGALAAIARIERGERGDWDCSRAMHAAYELDCRRPGGELQVLERVPVAAMRMHGVATLANWSFRLHGGHIEGRAPPGRWIDLGRPPFCEPAVPREALLALGLRPLTPHGGCFVAPRRRSAAG